jgi:heterodisulfide reductase subunit A-like polyferredoxin
VRRIWKHAIHPELKVGVFGHNLVKEMNMSSKVRGSVLVVGGGVAGMQSALDLANSGYSVHLLEKRPSIGGVMAQLDKTFPTNDCSI